MSRNRNGPVVVRKRVDETVHLAWLLGHGDVNVYPTASGAKWRVDCACGWVGAGMVRQVEAVGKGRYHLESAVVSMRRYARSHGISEMQALSELALSPDELKQLDFVIQARAEHRARVAEAMSDERGNVPQPPGWESPALGQSPAEPC